LIAWPTDRRSVGRNPIHFVTRLLIAAYLIEAGLLLVLTPWTAFWDRNVFAQTIPSLGDWMASGFARGGVAGVGLVTTVAGLRDLAATLLGRPDGTEPGAPQPEP
jgi:hypothetical protein